MKKTKRYSRAAVFCGLPAAVLMLYLILLPAFGQDVEAVELPEEARALYSQADFSESPLSELGKRMVLTRFALYFQELIVVKEYYGAYQECEKSPETLDCEKEYMAWYNSKNKMEEYRRYWRDAYVTWRSNWLTRLGIPNLPDSAGGTVDISRENREELELYEKWRDANGYEGRAAQVDGQRLARLSQWGLTDIEDLSIDQARQYALFRLQNEWLRYTLEEEFMCRYLISVLGKNPVECLSWRTQGIEAEPAEQSQEPTSEIAISVFPNHFIREGDWVNVIVSVVDEDGRIITGTSVHLVPEGSFEDSQEFYTNNQGIAVIPLSHDQEGKDKYTFQIYSQGVSRPIEIPVISPESLKMRLEDIVMGESDTFTFQPEFDRDIRVFRIQDGWRFEVEIQEGWANRDDIIQLFLEKDYGKMEEQTEKLVYQFVAYDIQKALDILIETKKILELVEIEQPSPA